MISLLPKSLPNFWKVMSRVTPKFYEFIPVFEINRAVHLCKAFFYEMCIKKCFVFQIDITKQAILIIVLLTIKFQKYFLPLRFFSNEINRQTIQCLVLSYSDKTYEQSVAESNQLRADHFLNRVILFAFPAVFVNSGADLKLSSDGWNKIFVNFITD